MSFLLESTHTPRLTSFKFKTLYYLCFLATVLSSMAIVSNDAIVFLINVLILSSYFYFKPNNILNPKNIVFAFGFLYVVLPSSVQAIYDFFALPYLLPWGKTVNWFGFQLLTYYEIILIYFVLFFSFHFFDKKDLPPDMVNYEIKTSASVFLTGTAIFFLFAFMQFSGGLAVWLNGYKEAFLLGREGNGLLNFLALFFVNIAVFLIGIRFFSEEKLSRKIFVLGGGLIFIIFSALIQGIKSRLIILLVILFFPYLIRMKFKVLKIIYFGFIFFALLFLGNYLRSDGYYDGLGIFVEYFMTYFNAYELHNLIVTKSNPGFFITAHHIFVKPMILLGFASPNADFDISVMLTKQYFPSDWESMRATQQWPLATELHFNYFGLILGWLPLVIYCYIVAKLYSKAKKGSVALSLIFILEFFRLFTVQRGVIIPWQMPIYLFFYFFSYLILAWSVKARRSALGND